MDFMQNLVHRAQLNEQARIFLKFTWFGDLACSSGPHYVRGEKKSLAEILSHLEKGYSDDLIENLACWALKDTIPAPLSLRALYDLMGAFQDLIGEHYEENRIRYSPDYPRLFGVQHLEEYAQVILAHSNCGGAMRSGLLGYGGVSAPTLFALVAMTHLHPEAVSGAFAVSHAVQAAQGGALPEMIRQQALVGARQGWTMARDFIAQEIGPVSVNGSIEERMQHVFESGDPCWGVEDMAAEGIETRFVIPAAVLVATQATELSAREALRFIVEQAIAIGGDPDTIGSIAMGIAGAYLGERLSEQIDVVIAGIDLDPVLVPPFLARDNHFSWQS